MTTKHTPGPWFTDGLFIVDNYDEIEIARCVPSITTETTDEEYKKKRANALLISAAPEMLKTLRRVLMAIDWTCTGDRLSDEQQADLIRAAIAKAEGTT